MSQPSPEKHWYQNGSIVFVIVGFACLVGSRFYLEHLNEKKREAVREQLNKPAVSLLPSGYLRPHWTGLELVVSVHHQFPGLLENGRLTVKTESDLVPKSSQVHFHSFEQWAPNDDHKVEIVFQLDPVKFSPREEIPIQFELFAQNSRQEEFKASWLGQTWKSNYEDSGLSSPPFMTFEAVRERSVPNEVAEVELKVWHTCDEPFPAGCVSVMALPPGNSESDTVAAFAAGTRAETFKIWSPGLPDAKTFRWPKQSVDLKDFKFGVTIITEEGDGWISAKHWDGVKFKVVSSMENLPPVSRQEYEEALRILDELDVLNAEFD